MVSRGLRGLGNFGGVSVSFGGVSVSFGGVRVSTGGGVGSGSAGGASFTQPASNSIGTSNSNLRIKLPSRVMRLQKRDSNPRGYRYERHLESPHPFCKGPRLRISVYYPPDTFGYDYSSGLIRGRWIRCWMDRFGCLSLFLQSGTGPQCPWRESNPHA